MTKFIACIAFVLSLLLLANVEASDCVFRPKYYAQQVTYYAPQTYVPNNYYDQKILIVPQVIAVERNRDHYYSIDGAYQQSLLADAIVGRLLQAQIRGGVQKPDPSQLEKVKSASVRRASGFQEVKLLKVLNDSCVKCHGAADKYPLVTVDNKILECSEEYAWKIFGKVSTGEMPKSSDALGNDETKLFYDFVIAQKGRK